MSGSVASTSEVTGSGVSRPGRASSTLDWVLVALLAALAGVLAVFGVFFLPAYAGPTPVPVVVVVIGVALAVIPRAAYRLTGRLLAAFLPVLVWFAVTVGLFLTHNGLYVAAPIVWQGWQFALLLGVGALSAAASVGLLWGDHLRAQIDAAGAGPVDAVAPQSADGGY